jgi:3-oxoacyl-[acyl-carrier-protein] synthase-3
MKVRSSPILGLICMGSILAMDTKLDCKDLAMSGLMDAMLQSDGVGRIHLHQKAGGSVKPPTHETIDAREHYIYQEGQAVFKWAVSKMADVSVDMMKKHGITAETLNWLVPHQANMRIIEATAQRMGIKREQVMINIQRFGNTTSATLPLCLWEWENQLRRGDNIILAAFGAGFTWGAVYLKWAYDGDKVVK